MNQNSIFLYNFQINNIKYIYCKNIYLVTILIYLSSFSIHNQNTVFIGVSNLNNKSVNTRFKLNLKATIYPIGSKRNKNSTSTTVSNSILYIAITGFLINNNTQAETIPNPR